MTQAAPVTPRGYDPKVGSHGPVCSLTDFSRERWQQHWRSRRSWDRTCTVLGLCESAGVEHWATLDPNSCATSKREDKTQRGQDLKQGNLGRTGNWVRLVSLFLI